MAVILLATLAAGCSSGVARFTTDDLFTASTSNQRAIISNEPQPFPGDVARTQPANGTYSEAPSRAAVEPAPVTRSSLPPVASAPAPAQVAVAPRVPAVDRTPTGTVARPVPAPTPAPAAAAPAAASGQQSGWVAEGGRLVTLTEGENLNSLSSRFGVPVKALMKANGLVEGSRIAAGQKIIIPTYVYADAKGNSAARQDAPARQPQPAPDKTAAVLPQQQRLKEPDAQPQAAAGLAPATPKTGGQGGGYTVVAGDTLYGVAKKTGAKVDAIRAANGLKPDAGLKVGQKLVIPAAGAAVAAAPAVDKVVTGTTGPAKPAADSKQGAQLATYTPPKRDDKALREAAASDANAPDKTGIGKMRWPVRGRVVSTYGRSNGSAPNDGIDIAVPEGTPVKAAENGVVIFAGEGLKDFGKTVLVRHSDGKVTVYGHASEIKVNRGDTVKRGQEIARSGMTGKADTPKLHFEVRDNSNPVDPQQFLE